MMTIKIKVARKPKQQPDYSKTARLTARVRRLQRVRHLLIRDMNATTRKATPAQKKLPVRNHTTIAIMPAGSMNRKILAMITIMTMPITSSRTSNKRS